MLFFSKPKVAAIAGKVAMEAVNHLKNRAMKTFLFFVAFCVFCASAFAQDVITLRNGDDIHALVQEIGADEVKYKRFDNPSGPNYTLKKSEILMITYANGSRELFATTPAPAIGQTQMQNNKGEVYFTGWGNLKYRSDDTRILPKDMPALFYDTPEAAKEYRSGNTFQAIATGFTLGGASLLVYEILHAQESSPNHKAFECPIFLSFLGLMILSYPFSSVGNSKIRSAVDIYNASVRQQASNVSLNFGITRSGGVGLTVNF